MNHSCLTMANLPYTNSYICERGGASRAMRLMISVNAFVNSFFNGSWTWTNYFNVAIAENIKWYLLETHDDWALGPPQANAKIRNDAVISVPIGALDYMLSNPKINEIKNVLHQARTNPQTA